MSIGSAIGSSLGRAIGSALAGGGGSAWSPLSLFAAGEKGVWYDPSDFSSMFQDSAGMTPVTAVGDPVGLILDKRRGITAGDDIVDTINTAAAWTPSGANTVIDEDDAVKITYVNDTTGATCSLSAAGVLSENLVNGDWYEVRFNAKISSGSAYVVVSNGVQGSIGPIINTTAYTEYSLIVGKGTSTPGVQLSAFGAGEILWLKSITVRKIGGSNAYQNTSGRRPLLQQDGSGFYYLDFDGTDDGLATAAIDFTATDKMTVCAGVRKDSDAAQGCIAELTASVAANNGAWLLAAPDAADATFAFDSKGTSQVDAVVSGNTAPMTAVLTGLSDISGDSCAMRVNGVLGDTDVGDQGTGNYSNAALYIGRRGGTTLPFNGRIYSLIVRGAATADLTSVENYVNGKTGAY